jgi:hypothetical protein
MCAISIELSKIKSKNDKINEFSLTLSLENIKELERLKNILIYTRKNIYFDGELAYKAGSLIHLILENELSKIKVSLKENGYYVHEFTVIHPDRSDLVYPDNQEIDFYTKEIYHKVNSKQILMENLDNFLEYNDDKSISLSITDMITHLMKIEGKFYNYLDVLKILKN